MIGMGAFEWLGLNKKDKLHRLVAGKYLKQLFKVHEWQKTIEVSVEQLKELCNKCIGLAAVLILVSFLYQRFMTGKDEEEKQER